MPTNPTFKNCDRAGAQAGFKFPRTPNPPVALLVGDNHPTFNVKFCNSIKHLWVKSNKYL